MSLMTGVYVMSALAVICIGAFTAFVAWLASNTKSKKHV